MMQYNDHLAWMEGNRVVVMRPDKAPRTAATTAAQASRQRAAARRCGRAGEAGARPPLLPAWLYREQRYRLPDTPKKQKGLINLGKLV